jgi:hypothetical protein
VGFYFQGLHHHKTLPRPGNFNRLSILLNGIRLIFHRDFRLKVIDCGNEPFRKIKCPEKE